MGGYEDYLFFLSERILAGLPNGENKAFRVPREAMSVAMADQVRADRKLNKLKAQGFRLSSSSLNELGVEVQLHSCTEVFSVSLLRYL